MKIKNGVLYRVSKSDISKDGTLKIPEGVVELRGHKFPIISYWFDSRETTEIMTDSVAETVKKIVLPSTLEVIRDNAFFNIDVENIKIVVKEPANLHCIEGYADEILGTNPKYKGTYMALIKAREEDDLFLLPNDNDYDDDNDDDNFIMIKKDTLSIGESSYAQNKSVKHFEVAKDLQSACKLACYNCPNCHCDKIPFVSRFCPYSLIECEADNVVGKSKYKHKGDWSLVEKVTLTREVPRLEVISMIKNFWEKTM